MGALSEEAVKGGHGLPPADAPATQDPGVPLPANAPKIGPWSATSGAGLIARRRWADHGRSRGRPHVSPAGRDHEAVEVAGAVPGARAGDEDELRRAVGSEQLGWRPAVGWVVGHRADPEG